MVKLPLKVGLVGCGIAAQFFHAPAYLLIPEVAVVTAIADPNQSNRQIVAQILGRQVKEYRSIEEMSAGEKLDMVDVMLPHNLYESAVPYLAKFYQNILVEKPFAKDTAAAKKILKATKDINLSVVHNYLYGSRYRDILNRINTGEIGQPYLVRLENFNTGMNSIDPTLNTPWRTDKESSGKGTFHNHGYHLVYLAKALMGSDIVKVTATMGNFYETGDTLDTAIVTLQHKNGGLSILLDGRLNNQDTQEVEEVLGTKGTLRVRHNNSRIEEFKKQLRTGSKIEVLKNSPYSPSMAECIKDFIISVKDGRQPSITPQEAFKTLEVTLAAYKSFANGRTISV